MDSPEINPGHKPINTYGQFNFNKSSKTVKRGKKWSFHQMVLGNLDVHVQKEKDKEKENKKRGSRRGIPWYIPCTKISSKLLILNIRAKATQLLAENNGVNFNNHGLGSVFLDMTSKVQDTKKNRRPTITNLCTAHNNIKEVERQSMS